MTYVPASGNDTGLPALYRHLSDLQEEAMHLEAMIKVLGDLEFDDPSPTGERSTIITLSQRLARAINEGLDQTNLPEVEISA